MREVKAEISIKGRCEEVLRAFTELDAMRQWWCVDRGLVEERVDGVWALAWDRSDQGFREGKNIAMSGSQNIIIRDYQGPEDFDLQYDFWKRVTADLPWAWKPTRGAG